MLLQLRPDIQRDGDADMSITEPKPVIIEGCTCPVGWRSLGILYGVSFGKGWVRLDDAPDCPHHGNTGLLSKRQEG